MNSVQNAKITYRSINDSYWGVVGDVGNNTLGKLLMKVRTQLQDKEKQKSKDAQNFAWKLLFISNFKTEMNWYKY
jgi:hypothetical protein